MSRLTIHLIPHVHWDREWYLSRSAFTGRLVPMMDGLIELLRAHPELRFHLDGQMVLVEDYLAVVPGARAAIEALVRGSQLGIGPWYMLADELIPSGAGLRRNLATGIRLARELGGEVPVLYSPDAFGHPAGLPDLGAEHGIRWALVWRGLGPVAGRDRDFYRWVGPGAGAVLLHHLPPEGYEMGVDLVTAGKRLPAVWRRLRDRLLARASTPELAVFIGADHHAPDPSLPELVGRIGELQPNATVRFSSLADFFLAAESSLPAPMEIGGELRHSGGHTWSLQGVHSSRARLKRRYARAERALVTVGEPLARAARLSPALVEHTWRTLLQCQFHDSLCGCCADPVAAEQEVRLEGVEAVTTDLARSAVFRLIGHDPDLARDAPRAAGSVVAVFNPAAAPSTGVVVAETTWFCRDELVGPPGDRVADEGVGYRAFHLAAPDGREFPVQVLRVSPGLERRDAPRHYPDLDHVDRVWIAAWLEDLPPGEVTRFQIREGARPFAARLDHVERDRMTLDNGLAMVTIGPDGLATLTDHAAGTRFERLLEVESEVDHGDLYTPDVNPATARQARTRRIRVVTEGPLVGAIEREWTLATAEGGLVHGRTIVALHAAEPGIRVRLELDSWASDHRLRLRLPVGLTEVDVGAPLGVERRRAGRLDRSWPDEAVLPTAPASGWLASADGTLPFRLEMPGFFEYELTETGDLAITLLRAVGQLSRPDGKLRRGNAGWSTDTPGAQEHGRHLIELAIGFAGWPGSQPWALGIRGVIG